MAGAALRFSLAGVRVRVETATPAAAEAVEGRYRAYVGGHDREPDLVLEVTHEPGFRSGRPSDLPLPLFAAAAKGDDIALWREDALGALSVPAERDRPVTGSFRVASAATTETVIRIALSVALPARGGLIVHASAARIGSRALAFCGASGSGKTSAVAAALAGAPAGAKLADELLVVRAIDGAWWAFVAPFHDREPLPLAEAVRLGGVHFLARGDSAARVPLAPTDALSRVSRHVLSYVQNARTGGHVLDASARLVAAVPCYDLQFRDADDLGRLIAVE